jgi:hypothetical protein
MSKTRADSLQEAIARAQPAHEAKQATAKPTSPIAKGPPSATAEAFGIIYIRGAGAEPDRLQRWVEASHRVFGYGDDPHLSFQLQECGFLDTMLLAFESESRTDPGPEPGVRYIIGQSFEFVIGDCWLLFTYEVLRTFRRSDRFSQLPEAQQEGFNELFRLVSLVRMPLAKREAAKTRKGDTYVFNAPVRVMHDELGTAGWRVFDKSNKAIVDVLRRAPGQCLVAVCGRETVGKSIESSLH